MHQNVNALQLVVFCLKAFSLKSISQVFYFCHLLGTKPHVWHVAG